MLDDEPRVAHVLFAAHTLEVGLPALAVGWIREHEVEFARRERVVRERGVLWTAHDVVGSLAAALEQQVGFADCVGLGVDLLPVQVGRDLLALLGRELLQGLLRDRQHPSGAAGTIVEEVGPGLDLVCDGEEQEPRHQRHGVARCPVLACLFVVLFVEAAHQLLEDGSHAVVVEAGVSDRSIGGHHRGGAQVDVGRRELLDERPERVGLRQA